MEIVLWPAHGTHVAHGITGTVDRPAAIADSQSKPDVPRLDGQVEQIPMAAGEMIELTAASSFIDWERLTGQSQFVVDLVSIPIFSAIAGLITNWTGVLMLFAPVHFTGFHMRGLKTVFPLLPRKVQILPIFAPDGVLGFQGFIPCRAEKMASLIVDKSIFRIGGIADFYQELEPDVLAEQLANAARPNVRQLATDVLEKEHSLLWQLLRRGTCRRRGADDVQSAPLRLDRKWFDGKD